MKPKLIETIVSAAHGGAQEEAALLDALENLDVNRDGFLEAEEAVNPEGGLVYDSAENKNWDWSVRQLVQRALFHAGLAKEYFGKIPSGPATLERFQFSEEPDVAAGFRHVRAFQDLTDSFLSTMPEEVLRKKEITVLYPGGGSHLAPLEFALRLFASGKSSAETVRFIYTDINAEAYEKTAALLEKLEEAGMLTVSGKDSVNKSKGVEKSVSCALQTAGGPKKIELVYAVNRSEPERGDNDYYKQTYADQADVIISHDSSDEFRTSYFLGSFLLSLKNSPDQKPRFLFVEDDNNEQLHTRWDLLPGRYQPVDQPYGCSADLTGNGIEDDHLGKAKYRAMAYFPDMNFYRQISREDLEVLLWEANTVSFPDEALRTPFGGVTKLYSVNDLAAIAQRHCEIFEKVEKIDPRLGQKLFAHLLRFLSAQLDNAMETIGPAFALLDAPYQKKCLEAFLTESEEKTLHIDEEELDDFFQETELASSAATGDDLAAEKFYGHWSELSKKLSVLRLAAIAARGDEHESMKLAAYVHDRFPHIEKMTERLEAMVAVWKKSDNYKGAPYTVYADRQKDGAMRWHNVREDREYKTMKFCDDFLNTIYSILSESRKIHCEAPKGP